ncbi:uncharacterized protein LOC144907028 [Branchiostoma floridae x Branchiostoma belcheri]
MWLLAGLTLLVLLEVGPVSTQMSLYPEEKANSFSRVCPRDCFCVNAQKRQTFCYNMDYMPIGLNPHTRGLLIADSSFTTIENNAFKGVPYLVEMNMTDNLITTIYPGAFNFLELLEKLDLSNNKLTTFPREAIAKVGKQIKSLNVGGNPIAESLTAESFEDMEALKELYLYNMNLSVLENGLLQGLKSLKVLDLSKNNFKSLPEEAIQGLDNLTEIVMFGNPFVCDKDALWLQEWYERSPPKIGPGPTCMEPPRLAGYAAAALPSAVLSAQYEMVIADYRTDPPTITPLAEDAIIKGLIWRCPTTTILTIEQFKECVEMVELDISENNIVDIQPGAFSRLKKLGFLYLRDNKLTKITASVLEGLTNLEILDVSNNQIICLPPNIKELLPNLKFVVGYNNPWTCDCNLAAHWDLFAHHFHEKPAVCAFPPELEGKLIREVPKEAMVCTPPEILFVNEYITVQETGDAFLHCQTSGLPVPTIQWKTPDGNVVTIDEPVGNKEVLNNGTLWIKGATGYDGGSYICSADNGGGKARGNTTLRVCPEHCRCLDILSVHCFQANVSKIPSDTRLFLMLGTDLKEVRKDLFEDLVDLEELDLDNNQITDIDVGAFEDLPKLRLLFLYRNALGKLQTGVFKGMINLQKIYLSSNNITKVEDRAFEGLNNLLIIQLHENQIEEIGDGAFEGLPTLIDLDLHLNNLTTIPGKAISTLSNLKRVQLFENMITMVKEHDFKDLERLQIIYLQDNLIQMIENGAFENLPALQWLDLSSNQLVVIPSGVFNGLDALQRLDLSDNALITLSGSLRTELPSLKFVIGGGNSWHCDCNMILLRDWFGYSNVQPPPIAFPIEGSPPYRPYLDPDPILTEEFLQHASNPPLRPVPYHEEGSSPGDNARASPCVEENENTLPDDSYSYSRQYQYGGGGGYDYNNHYSAAYTGYGRKRKKRQAASRVATCATPPEFADQNIDTVPISRLVCEAILFVENGVKVVIGHRAKLSCVITEEIGIGKFWVTPQGAVVKFGGSVGRVRVSGDGTLTIDRVEEEDAGGYVCLGGTKPVIHFLYYVKPASLPPPPSVIA